MEMPNPLQKRQVAYKLSVYDILSAAFLKDDASAGHIKMNGVNVSRVNLIATAVYKSEPNANYSEIMIDDGTGKISMRAFENSRMFERIDIGDLVLVVGRVREFNTEKYVLPEALKKIYNFEWMNVRKAELKNLSFAKSNQGAKSSVPAVEDVMNDSEKIYLLIKKFDSGNGASVDEVIKNSRMDGAERIIQRLLENGDVFEIKPGKLKVLE